jgi:hypothetical protein
LCKAYIKYRSIICILPLDAMKYAVTTQIQSIGLSRIQYGHKSLQRDLHCNNVHVSAYLSSVSSV